MSELNGTIEVTQLTEAELKMIQLKREKEEIEKKEVAARKEIEIAKNIQRKKEEIEKFKSKKAADLITINGYVEEMLKIAPDSYDVVRKNNSETFEVYDYLGDGKRNLHFLGVIGYESVILQSKDSRHYIEFRDHETYSDSGYDTKRWINNGLKMQIEGDYSLSNRYYKNVKKVNEIIQEKISENKETLEKKNIKEENIKKLLSDLPVKYPNAEVKKESYSDLVNVTHSNGVIVQYSVSEYELDKFFISKIIHGSLNQNDVVNALINLPKKVS